jgi:hypothetical protein
MEALRQEKCPGKLLCVCDFYVEGMEVGEFNGSSLRIGKVSNVDHHSDLSEMKVFVSSAILALKEAEQNPSFDTKKNVVVIHHTDTDSVLTALIMSGAVTPQQARDWHFRRAAIAADHTGEPDTIADLLQALRDGEFKGQGTTDRLKFSVKNLQDLLRGQQLEPVAAALLEEYQQERLALQEMVARGEYGSVGEKQQVSWINLPLDSKADAVALPALFPNSLVAFTCRTNEGTGTPRNFMNVRLGKGLAGKGDLRDIMKAVGLPFGGRWNAGANKRKGGTEMPPQDFAEKIVRALEELK